MIFVWTPIFSDEVTLKSGKVLTNVKAKIKKDSLEVQSENLSVANYPKKEVKGLKVRPVIWKAQTQIKKSEEEIKQEILEEEARVAEASVKGDEFIPRDPDEEINPWGNFALGLIPGYSGLYRTESKKAAITFSVLEVMALGLFADVWGAKRTSTSIAGLETGGLIFSPDIAGVSAEGRRAFELPVLVGVYGLTTFEGRKGGLSGYNYVNAGQPASTQARYSEMKNVSLLLLASILTADGIASYFAADAWNEGTYSGEKSKDFVRPTTPWSRALRSAFLPGWGQIYGGNTWKGAGWMLGGVALLGNVIVNEAEVTDAKKKYQNNSGGIFGTLVGSLYATRQNPVASSDEKLTSSLTFGYLLSEPTYQRLKSSVADRNLAWTMYGGYLIVNIIDAYFFSGVTAPSAGSVLFKPGFSYQPAPMVGTIQRWESIFNFEIQYIY